MSASHIPMAGGAEFDAIRSLMEVWGPNASGIGDDAALLSVPRGEQLVASTDACIENVHFRRAWITPEEMGARAVAAALSDLAAMAAKPIGLLIALAVPREWRDSLKDIARGVARSAAASACPVVGGNLSDAADLSLTTTVLGSTARPLHRSGVREGDLLFVTGELGGPAAAVRAWESGSLPSTADRSRFVNPTPRISEALWLAARGAHAAIDLSDGLAGDAEHLAAASGVTIEITPGAVPCVAGVRPEDVMRAGEEYELLVAVPREAFQAHGAIMIDFLATFGIPLTPVGVAHPRGAALVRYSTPVDPRRAFDHFM